MIEETLPEKPAEGAALIQTRGKGPRKQEDRIRTRQIKGKLLLKSQVKKGVVKSKSGVKMGRARRGTDQVGLKPPDEKSEGYVRFRVRMDDGRMSIVDSQFVNSTLVAPEALHGSYAYEVTNEQNRMHVDSIQDLGVTRSFANPRGPLEEQGHYFDELASYEFDVRVPAKELTRASLPKISITLYRVKDRRQAIVPNIQPLNAQFEGELREVARMDGIPAETLPESMQANPRSRTRRSKKSAK